MIHFTNGFYNFRPGICWMGCKCMKNGLRKQFLFIKLFVLIDIKAHIFLKQCLFRVLNGRKNNCMFEIFEVCFNAFKMT